MIKKKKKKVKRKKLQIDYLQFLSQPDVVENNPTLWFFTYLDISTEQIVRVQRHSQLEIQNEYQRVQKNILKFIKSKSKKIKTDTVVDESKKLPSRFKGVKSNNKFIKKEFFTKAIELKIQGFDKYEIQNRLIETYKIGTEEAIRASDYAYGELSKEIDDDYIKLTIFTHSQSYDDLYRKFSDLKSYKLAMKTLRSKETLNGIGQDIFEIQVNNLFEGEEQLISYAINRLDEKEQKELVEILNKIKNLNDQNSTTKELTA